MVALLCVALLCFCNVIQSFQIASPAEQTKYFLLLIGKPRNDEKPAVRGGIPQIACSSLRGRFFKFYCCLIDEAEAI